MNEIKHFKLANGEEIVCDVVEWPDPEGDSPDIVIRNVFRLELTEVKGDGVRYYQFKPWMVYQDEPDLYQVLNGNHIVGEANPPEKLIEQYIKVVGLDNMSPQDIDKKLLEYVDELKKMLGGDSDSNLKIVPFPNRNKMH